jgi:hypothetical protein
MERPVRPRANVFAIHSWDDAVALRRMQDLLRVADPPLAHYSVPPERALVGSPDDVREGIFHRISSATAVVVLNSPGLHRREMATFEMELAAQLGKRIVVVQPHGDFGLPVPRALDGHVYRYATWRSDVLGRAIRGEYPQDGRIFELAEVADRRDFVALLAAGVGTASFAVAIRSAQSFLALQRELKVHGIELRWGSQDTNSVVRDGLLVAGIGLLLGSLSGDGRTAAYAALGGAALGIAVGVRRTYEARLLGARETRILAVRPGAEP